MRRVHLNLSERGAEIRRKPGRLDKESNLQIECALELYEDRSLSIREFLLTIAAKSSDPIEHETDTTETVSLKFTTIIG